MNGPHFSRAEVEAELLRQSFREYSRRFWPVVTGAPLTWNNAIEQVCSVLQRVGDGELTRVLIAMPSGVGKSTMLALFSAWRLVRNPAHRALHMMHGSDIANTESIRVRRLIESDEHRELYPQLMFHADENRINNWATTNGGRYLAVGAATAILGRRVLEAVLDDPLDESDKWSRDAKDKFWDWFTGLLMSRLDSDRAPIVVVHQRLCVDDPIGRCLEQRDRDGNPLWFLLELPAEDDEGNLLAPTVLTRARLDDIKTQNPRRYRAMFLQRPDSEDGAAIARTAWGFHAPPSANPLAARPMGCAKPDVSPTVRTPDEFDRTVISCDPTFGSLKGDYCSIQVWAAAGAQRFLLDRWKKKSKQREQREALKMLREKFPDATILIELAAGGSGMVEELEAEGVQDVEGATVGSTSGSKSARLENVSPGIERGECFLPLGMHDLAGFVETLAGQTRDDDCQDACSQALHWLNVNAGANDTVTLLLRAFALDNASPETNRAAQAAEVRADRERRSARLDRLEAKKAAGEPLSRGEALHLRMWRGRPRKTGNE